MKLPNCWSCNYHFKWKELLFLFKPKECTQCGKKQYVTAQKRLQAAWMAPVTVVIMFLGLSLFDLSWPAAILLGLALLTLGIIISPFTYEFTDQEEPLV